MIPQFSRFNGGTPPALIPAPLTMDVAATEALYNHVLQLGFAYDIATFPTAIYMAQADDLDDEATDDGTDLEDDLEELDADDLEGDELNEDA